MKTFKGTKAKTEIQRFHNGYHIWLNGKKICSVWDSLFTPEEVKANAKLIAAAPQLLEALELIMSVSNDHAIIRIANKAIKKAL